MRREAFHRRHEVGDQIGAALQHHIHLRPVGLYRFVQRDHLVAPGNIHAAEKNGYDYENDENNNA